jgi:hypothetical protein
MSAASRTSDVDVANDSGADSRPRSIGPNTAGGSFPDEWAIAPHAADLAAKEEWTDPVRRLDEALMPVAGTYTG